MNARDDDYRKPQDSRGYWSAVAAQLVVALPLINTQLLGGRKVVFQVDRPQRSLPLTDLRCQQSQSSFSHLLCGKFLIQSAFAFDQFLSSRYGFALHRLVQL